MNKPKLTHNESGIELSSCLACEHYNHQGLFRSGLCNLTMETTTIECNKWISDKQKEAHYKKGWTLTL
mgnify:CR=1 FL=1